MEAVLSASSLLVMPFWFLMIFLPAWTWTRRVVASPLIALPAALLYAALVVPNLGESPHPPESDRSAGKGE